MKERVYSEKSWLLRVIVLLCGVYMAMSPTDVVSMPLGILSLLLYICGSGVMLWKKGNALDIVIPLLPPVVMALLGVSGVIPFDLYALIAMVYAFACGVYLSVAFSLNHEKITVFTFLSVLSALFAVGNIVLTVYEAYHGISLDVLERAVADFATSVENTARQAFAEMTAQGIPSGVLNVEQMLSQTSSLIRAMIVPMILFVSLLLATLPTALCRFFLAFFGGSEAEKAVFSDREWYFKPSVISGSVFYISYFVLLIADFAAYDGMVVTALSYVVFLLSYVYGYCGVRCLVKLLHRKIPSLFVCALIVVAGIVMFSPYILMLLPFVGVIAERRIRFINIKIIRGNGTNSDDKSPFDTTFTDNSADESNADESDADDTSEKTQDHSSENGDDTSQKRG